VRRRRPAASAAGPATDSQATVPRRGAHQVSVPGECSMPCIMTFVRSWEFDFCIG